MAVAHGQVATLDQQQAEVAGEIGLLEIGLVVGAGRQQADARIAAPGASGKAGAERLEERREPLDVHGAVEVRPGARQHEAVGERVAGARRGLHAITQHPPAPVRPAADVGGIELDVGLALGQDAGERLQIIRAAGDGGGRQGALVHQETRTVDVLQDLLDQLGALGHASGDGLPFRGLDQQGQMADRPAFLGVVAIGAIGRAGVADVPVGRGETPGHLLGAELDEARDEGEPRGPRPPVGADELVRHAR